MKTTRILFITALIMAFIPYGGSAEVKPDVSGCADMEAEWWHGEESVVHDRLGDLIAAFRERADELLEDADNLKAYDREGRMGVAGGMPGESNVLQPHIVFSMEEMVRYVRFRELLS